jgi:NAD(P)-dependent dehydrogenase (short-subunit alcohol dehydrogenase family)
MRESPFAGQAVLVTGGARGFGRAVALSFADAGASVAVADLGARKMEDAPYAPSGNTELAETVADVTARGVPAIAIEADVTSAADCRQMAKQTMEAFGRIDVLVANAGVATLAPAWELSEREWDLVQDVCLKGVWLTTKYVVPEMMRRRYGKIIVTASRNGLRVERGYAHYNAAKAGVIHYMKTLALELGEYDINVNAICPTQMADKSAPPAQHTASQQYWDQVVGHPDATWEEFDAASGRENLFSSCGQPDFHNVARSVLWLASEDSKLVTGIALPVDAGYIAKRGG